MLLPRRLEKVLRMTALLLRARTFSCRCASDRALRLDRTKYRSHGVGLNYETLRAVRQKEVDIFSARGRSIDRAEWESRSGRDRSR